ncbi:MAG: flagellar basal body P-ring formation chaperone FlgA [Paracoccaceae bacterium]
MAIRTLPVGTIIARNDLTFSEKVGATEASLHFSSVVGKEVRRAIFKGRPVTDTDLGPPTLVNRNAIVDLLFQTLALRIRTAGRALDAGGRGETVRVLNLDSRRVVVGRVIGPGQVEVRR